jgi:hypothetical protein
MDLPESLQRRIVETGARVRVGYPLLLRPFLHTYIGITLGRTIYLAPKLLDREAAAVDATLRHELAHVQQILRLGIFRFYWRYIREYITLRMAKMSHQQAYDAISFEKEAKAAARGDEGVPV